MTNRLHNEFDVFTASGRTMSLLAPRAEMVDFECDIPDSLARIARFNGHVPSGPYSVAQHCVMGADILLRETGNRELAAAFLLHDAHEAYIGDIARPVKWALASMNNFPRAWNKADVAVSAVALLEQRLDDVIHAAAGLRWPLAADIAASVKQMDKRMLDAEMRWLMPRGAYAPASAPTFRVIGKIKIWPWPDAADAYRECVRKLLPAAKRPPRSA